MSSSSFSAQLPKSLLRFSTAGSVDDGKSTFIGRLLYDTGNIYDDHVEALKAKAEKTGDKKLPLALVTDGLRAEREQGITIDVAYRYFSTPKRRYILADSPGHEQYTRNMATAASLADLTVILVDARNGIVSQTKRHAFVTALLGVPRLLVAINKMDLVDYSEARFNELKEEFTEFASKLGVRDIRFIPVVSLDGDNIVKPSAHMPWYHGETVESYLDEVYIAGDKNQVDLRFPVQWVIRHRDSFRGFAGTIESGSLRVGEEIIALPGQKSSIVTAIQTSGENGKGKEVLECSAGDAVVVSLRDEIDIARGSLLVRPHNAPRITKDFQAMLIWFSEEPLKLGSKILVRHTTREVRGEITEISYVIDIHELHRKEKATLELNDIARVSVKCHEPLFLDPYQKNRGTGNFICIDPITNKTLAAGLVIDRDTVEPAKDLAPQDHNLHSVPSSVTLAERRTKWKTPPLTLWLTGLSGSGKSTIAQALEAKVFAEGMVVVRLDGDMLRSGLNNDLGFSESDRTENMRRTAEIAKLLNQSGILVIASFVSPLASQRALAREIIGQENFQEIYVNASLAVCEKRDPHGLYKKARGGEIKEFTGVSSPYEEPEKPELVLDSEKNSLEVCTEVLEKFLKAKN